jgi:hypothetical protein
MTVDAKPLDVERAVYGVAVELRVYRGVDADARARVAGDDFDDLVRASGNLLVNAGLTRLTSLLTAAGGQALTNTSARIGVGDSSTAAAVTDTDLGAAAGSTHRQFEVMQATFPSTATGVVTLQAVFGTSEANFVWNEWGIDIGTPTVTAGTTVNTLFNHKVINLITKTSNAAVTFTVTITFS